MDQAAPPHEALVAYVGDALGRRREIFGELVAELFEKLVLGVTDQLSGYVQCSVGARLKVGSVTLRHGALRTYVVAPIADRGGPLRLRDAMRRWDMMATDSASTLVFEVNGRRWSFVDKHFHSVLEPLLSRVADKVALYYRERPGAQPKVGIIRFMEDVHATYLVAEIDDRSETVMGGHDPQSRYLMQ